MGGVDQSATASSKQDQGTNPCHCHQGQSRPRRRHGTDSEYEEPKTGMVYNFNKRTGRFEPDGPQRSSTRNRSPRTTIIKLPCPPGSCPCPRPCPCPQPQPAPVYRPFPVPYPVYLQAPSPPPRPRSPSPPRRPRSPPPPPQNSNPSPPMVFCCPIPMTSCFPYGCPMGSCCPCPCPMPSPCFPNPCPDPCWNPYGGGCPYYGYPSPPDGGESHDDPATPDGEPDHRSEDEGSGQDNAGKTGCVPHCSPNGGCECGREGCPANNEVSSTKTDKSSQS